MPARHADYAEDSYTSALIAAGGNTTHDLDISELAVGYAIVRIEEVHSTGTSDFDVEIWESATMTDDLNRIYYLQNQDSESHDLIGAKGAQFHDRDATLATSQPQFHLKFTNNDTVAGAVSIRIRYSTFFMR